MAVPAHQLVGFATVTRERLVSNELLLAAGSLELVHGAEELVTSGDFNQVDGWYEPLGYGSAKEKWVVHYRSYLTTRTQKLCLVCQQPTTKRCSRCREASYCSMGCQRKHWKAHKGRCG
jgi:hypothetical protein